MKRRHFLGMLLGLFFGALPSTALAQNTAAEAILRVGAAAGIVSNEPGAVLQAMVQKRLISPALSGQLRASVQQGSMASSLFVIFVADILNGTGPTPTYEQAVLLFQARGIPVPRGPQLTATDVVAVVSTPGVAAGLAESYQNPITPLSGR